MRQSGLLQPCNNTCCSIGPFFGRNRRLYERIVNLRRAVVGCSSYGWHASLRRDGDGLCENSINACSKSSECRDSIPTKGGCDWWREYAIEVDFGLKIGCRLRFIRVHDFAANRAGVGACRACRAEGEIDIMASYLLPFYLISEVAEARVDNRPKYPALGFDSNFGSFRINEQCRESSA